MIKHTLPALFTIAALTASPVFVAPLLAQDAPAADAEKPKAAVEPIDAAKLKEALPETLGNLKRGNRESQKIKMGEMTLSTAKAEYSAEKGKEGVPAGSLTFLDYGNAEVIAGMAAWSQIELDRETDNGGFEKTIKVDDQPAMQSYQGSETKTGTLTVAVGQRVLVTAEFSNVSAEEFKKLCTQLPIKTILDLVKK